MLMMARPILTIEQQDMLVQGILADWKRMYPQEVGPCLEYARKLKAQFAQNPTGKTKHGHILGAFPQYVADRISTMLNDPNWMTNNPKIIGMVFKYFEVGRVAYWRSGGGGATSGRITLG